MNNEALKENIRTLAQIIGLSEKNAAEMLRGSIGIVVDESSLLNVELAASLALLIQRTVRDVRLNPKSLAGHDVLVNVGGGSRTEEADVFVSIDTDVIMIGEQGVGGRVGSDKSNPIWALIGACFTAAQVIRRLTGSSLPVPALARVQINAKDIFGDSFSADEKFDIGSTWLAGAGAIGNAFVYALSLLNPEGELHIVDPDIVEGGNLNRCICFDDSDLGSNKAEQLAKWMQKRNTLLKVIPHQTELAKVPERDDGPWLPRLVVAVDSRLARRNLQNEIPGEVFDASTTDIREIVLHFNSQPLDGDACMSCIYFQDAAENAHELHVAEVLGVTIDDVRSGFVSEEAAAKIKAKNARISDVDLKGLAYDSLFKQLCGEGKLLSSEDKQVFAPFAFVSVLAGVLLAIEFKRRSVDPKFKQFNYWKISPWAGPVIRAQRRRSTMKECSFCSKSVMLTLARSFWAHT